MFRALQPHPDSPANPNWDPNGSLITPHASGIPADEANDPEILLAVSYLYICTLI
jgi:hypothetical protein